VADDPRRGRLRELVRVFGLLGVIGFGGPAAHIALMRREVVERRGWLDDRRFLDLMALTNLLPGPNSTEMAIHVGRLRAGWLGLVVAGLAFILPASAIVLAFAWAYAEFGATPPAEALLYGIKPVVIAIIVLAIVQLGRRALAGLVALAVAVATVLLYLVGVSELVLLFGGALVYAAIRGAGRLAGAGGWLRGGLLLPVAPLAAIGVGAVALPTLFLSFLKIGAVLYGSGYVLVAFLRADFVERLGWLTDRQLLDAVAVGQVTPGPLFTTATFVGYLVAGFPGAVVATVAIFLPAFLFVALVAPLIDRVRERPLTAALADGLNAAALGLMAAVTIQLGGAAIVDPLTAVLALAALAVLLRFGGAVVWLVLGGAVIGLLNGALTSR